MTKASSKPPHEDQSPGSDLPENLPTESQAPESPLPGNQPPGSGPPGGQAPESEPAVAGGLPLPAVAGGLPPPAPAAGDDPQQPGEPAVRSPGLKATTTGATTQGYPPLAPRQCRPRKHRLLTPSFSPSRLEVELLGAPPRVLLTPAAYMSMCGYVTLASQEVGWMGTVSLTPQGDFLIEETFLLDQEVSGADTELSYDGVDLLRLELLSQGPAGEDKVRRLRFWGHSHVHFEPRPSPIDKDTLRTRKVPGRPWYIRGIFNKFGDAWFTVARFDLGYLVSGVPWAVVDSATGETLLESPAPASGLTDGYSGLFGEWFPGLHAAPTPVARQIPASLLPTRELLAAIQAELDAKVKVRPLQKWIFPHPQTLQPEPVVPLVLSPESTEGAQGFPLPGPTVKRKKKEGKKTPP